MEISKSSRQSKMINEQTFKKAHREGLIQQFSTGQDPLFNKLAEEDREDFFHYITWLGFAKEPNMMLLSSMHHYYYDMNDLKGVQVLVNLKYLNRIRQLNGFLHSIFRLLPAGAKFLGCFEEDRNPEGVAKPIYRSLKLFNDIINFLEARTERRLTRNGVSRIMESHGFRIADMTGINGIIYFMSNNTRGCGK